jgi:hypothetical protein
MSSGDGFLILDPAPGGLPAEAGIAERELPDA